MDEKKIARIENVLMGHTRDKSGNPHDVDINEIDDVTISSPADNEVLAYDDTSSEWINQTAAEAGLSDTSHTHAIDDLSDVIVTSVADNEVLAYDSGSSKWINQTAAEAGLAASSHTHTEAEITDLGTYLENVVEDTTPQLGGDLNAQGNNIINVGFINYGTAEALTVSGGAVTASQTVIVVDGEGSTTDDLVTINGTSVGDEIIIFKATGAYTLTIKDGTGNMQIAGDFAMNSVADTIRLINRGGTLYELSRSNNA